jgi:hypothetical protein
MSSPRPVALSAPRLAIVLGVGGFRLRDFRCWRNVMAALQRRGKAAYRSIRLERFPITLNRQAL